MKIIQVNFENSTPVLIQDNDESPLMEYSKKISNILDNTNISILHTSEGSLVLRPDRIVSILVNSLEKLGGVEKSQTKVNKKITGRTTKVVPTSPSVESEKEDIIKD